MPRALLLASATTAAPALAARARPRLHRAARVPSRGPARPILRAVDPSEDAPETTAADAARAARASRDAPSSSSSSSSSSPDVSRRAALLNLAFFGVSIPLWRDVLHDLGYLHGAEDEPADLPVPPPGSGYAVATFAGGCFWCMERPFDVLDGVLATTSGYCGGDAANPTYHQVGAGATGHRESVQILYDPSKVSYEELLNVYWHQIDPTREDGMFLDGGMQYTSAIFVDGPEQRRAAEASVAELDARGIFPGPIKTKVIDLDVFWPAEKYHQDYYRLNGGRYGFYRSLSGRDEFVQGVWGVDEWQKYTAGGH